MKQIAILGCAALMAKVVASTPTTALVSVDTQFGKDKYTDTFALVRDGEAWKIVAKIYHAK